MIPPLPADGGLFDGGGCVVFFPSFKGQANSAPRQ